MAPLLFALISLSSAHGHTLHARAGEKEIMAEIGSLRSTPDAERGAKTTKIALEIRALPVGQGKMELANMLANLSTEGDFGHSTLQEVATTLAKSLGELPDTGKADPPYMELATLVAFEHVKVSLNNKSFTAAKAQLTEIQQARKGADFKLADLDGKNWTLSSLKGKVVLVNFWATWCPPCRKEMPDLDTLYKQYKDKGLVILAISDEKMETVKGYLAKHPVSYTVLLDPGRTVNQSYRVEGIPNSYIYNRQGKLIAGAEDMRTKGQFLQLLGKAGLK